jgi:putative transposase
VNQARASGLRVATVQHDLDTKFTAAFDKMLKRKQVKVKLSAYRSPNTNAFVERFIQSIQQECLDRFVVFGEQHCDVLVREYVEHYLTERPHQGIGIENEVLSKARGRGRKKKVVPDKTLALSAVRCRQRLGGLLKSYSRAA